MVLEIFEVCQVNFDESLFVLIICSVSQCIFVLEEVTYATGEPRTWCTDYQHFVRVRWRLDARYATKRTRPSSQQPPSNSSSAETLRIYSSPSTRFDCVEYLRNSSFSFCWNTPFRLCSSLAHSLPHLLLFFLFSFILLIFFYCPSDPFYQNRPTPFPGVRS